MAELPLHATTEYTLSIYSGNELGSCKQICNLRRICKLNNVYGGTVILAGSGKHAGENRELTCVTHRHGLLQRLSNILTKTPQLICSLLALVAMKFRYSGRRYLSLSTCKLRDIVATKRPEELPSKT